jgi:type I restriction enzyme S subunit
MFTFSKKIDSSKEKLFLFKRSELEGRGDPEYYRPRHFRDIELLESSPYKLTTLDKVCTRIVDGPFGSAIKASDYVESGIPFIRVADVTRGEGTIKTEGMIYISQEAHLKINRSKVLPDDVVIAKTGATMGAASVVPETLKEANIRGDLAALTANSDILPEFVVAYINTKIGQRLFWRLNSGGTRGRVVIGNLKNYPILVPPKEIQKKALGLMNNAYSLKRKKIHEAKSILAGIDNYLLITFGIEVLTKKYNKSFLTYFSELKSRHDSSYYKPEYKAFEAAYKSAPIKTIKIGRIGKVICGPFGSSVTSKDYAECGTPLIRISNINSEGDLSSKGIIYIPDELAESLSSYKVFEGDLIVSQRGSLGLVSVVTAELSGAIISANLVAIKNLRNIEANYIQVIIGSVIGRNQMKRKMSGQVQEKITTGDIKSLEIPVIDHDKQLEIIKKIRGIRNKAYELFKESKEELTHEMLKVERLILGLK